jgi:hypothetical protein
MTDEITQLKNTVKDEWKKNNICFMTFEGLAVSNIDEFIKQPVDGILYDLNRDEPTTLSSAEHGNNDRWVNDFAVAKTIRHQAATIATLTEQLKAADKDMMEAIANTSMAMLTILEQLHNELHSKTVDVSLCPHCQQYIQMSAKNRELFARFAEQHEARKQNCHL